MGHNLGMSHDFNADWKFEDKDDSNYRVLNNKVCKGYMDYDDSTNYWSHCSVSNFTAYIDKQSNFCLDSLDWDKGKYEYVK